MIFLFKFLASKENNGFIQNLLNKLKNEGKVEIPLKHKSAGAENIQEAKIKEKLSKF